MTSRTAAAALLLLGAALPLLPARAETRAEEDATPLSLVRRAGLVAVVRAGAPPAGAAAEGVLGTLVVEEVIRGEGARAGDSLAVAGHEGTEDVRILPGLRAVAFLSVPAAGRTEVLCGALGLLAAEEGAAAGGEGAAVTLVRTLCGDLGPEGKFLTPGKVRAALVAAVRDGAPRLRAGAAFDLVRETGLLGEATEGERADLAAAFRAVPNRDRGRAHLARAVGMLRPEGAGAMLVEAVLEPEGFALRRAAGEALGLLGDEGAVRLLASRTAGATAETRALIAGVLGHTGMAAARPPLEALAGSAEAPVRVEAAVGLGRLRTADAAAALLARLVVEKDARARRAVAWALAQCDHPEAWRALREAAAREDEEAAFRAFVRTVLENPRRSQPY